MHPPTPAPHTATPAHQRAAPDGTHGEGAALRLYGLLTWAAVAVHMARFLGPAATSGAGAAAFSILVLLTYGTFFTIAALLPAGILRLLVGRFGWSRWLVRGVAVAAPSALHLLFVADTIIHRMYGYHLNGMIWNVVVTPGGIESLGADSSTNATVAGIVVLCFAMQTALLVTALRWTLARPSVLRATTWRRIALAFGVLVVAHAAERVTFGLAYAAESESIMAAGAAFPQHARTRMVGLGRSLGLVPPRTDADGERRGKDVTSATLRYPLKPLVRPEGAPSPNIVWLVAESLRADMLTAEIMPATTEFARGGRRFNRHFSAGNGTRMGVFGMFYGLYGSYWFPVLAASRGPVLMDQLIDGGYDVECFTSAKFTFPEFDRTVWRRVPAEKLHEGDASIAGWRNDKLKVTDLLASIDAVPPSKPFFRFLFFESPHAPYRFPPESVIRPDFEPSMNYVTMDLTDPAVVARIKNRYVNACHALDAQLARVYEHLEAKSLLANTIVIVTGDHGEEFMERGRWGHHSAFTDEQVRTPLVIRGGGIEAGVDDRMTSHLDLPATVLARLGVTNPPPDYSLGVDVLSGPRTAPAVAAGWEDMGLIAGDCKIVLPFSGGDTRPDAVTRADDSRLPDAAAERAMRTSKNAAIVEVLRNMRRFAN